MDLFPEDALFVVCSDNIPLCKKAFQDSSKNIKIIEEEHGYMDLFLMSLCHHNIISNSSFSWWAAYLNRNPNKIVIGPKKWFNTENPKYDTSDLLPDEWIKV